MTVAIFTCNTCKTRTLWDVYGNILEPTKLLDKIHYNHDIKIDFKDDVPLKMIMRPMTKYILYHQQNTSLIGVEIGVKYGDNAYNILNALNMKKLYLVDPYEFYDGYDESDFKDKSPKDSYMIARKLLNPYRNKISFIKKTSKDAEKDIPNDLDFVYIDGNHSYEYVMEDLNLYYKKLKINGIIGGHDFALHRPEVVRAVSDFIYKNNLKRLRSENIDYWIVKEKEI